MKLEKEDFTEKQILARRLQIKDPTHGAVFLEAIAIKT
jgi:hypothetical protein